MLPQTPSQIFKFEFRTWQKTENYLISQIVDNEYIKAFEVIIRQDGVFHHTLARAEEMLILPLYGIVNIDGEACHNNQLKIFSKEKDGDVGLENATEGEEVNILIFIFKNNGVPGTSLLDLNIPQNAFAQFAENTRYTGMVGLYEGRREDHYTLRRPGSKLFGMVLNGAFEFQNRLMENRDAIILSGIGTLEYEALSENALLLFFELNYE